MSRSYKKISICGYTNADSDKKGKRQINRRLRGIEKANIHRAISKGGSFDDFITTDINVIQKFSYLRKDGKQFIDIRNYTDDLDYFRKCLKK